MTSPKETAHEPDTPPNRRRTPRARARIRTPRRRGHDDGYSGTTPPIEVESDELDEPDEEPAAVAEADADDGADDDDDPGHDADDDADDQVDDDVEDADAAEAGDQDGPPQELRELLQPHLDRAVVRNQDELRRQHGAEAKNVVIAAHRAIRRFAPPSLLEAMRANPVFQHEPNLIAMMAAVDRHVRRLESRQRSSPEFTPEVAAREYRQGKPAVDLAEIYDKTDATAARDHRQRRARMDASRAYDKAPATAKAQLAQEYDDAGARGDGLE